MTKKKEIPVDDRHVDASNRSSGEYLKATETGRRLRERILVDPAGRNSYVKALADMESHQASLAQVRKLRSLAQSTVAELMGMDQSEISRLERRSDLLLSTLRRFIQAMGGDLHLIATFPGGDVELLIGDETFEENTEQDAVGG